MRAADDHQKLVDLERLLQVVERAELHRLDRALDGRVRGHHQDLRPLAAARPAGDLANQIEAAQFRHQLSTTSRSNGRSPMSFSASRGLPVSRDSMAPSWSSACFSAWRIFARRRRADGRHAPVTSTL